MNVSGSRSFRGPGGAETAGISQDLTQGLNHIVFCGVVCHPIKTFTCPPFLLSCSLLFVLINPPTPLSLSLPFALFLFLSRSLSPPPPPPSSFFFLSPGTSCQPTLTLT